MVFNLHPWKYRVRVCPGPLLHEGKPVAATVCGREILLCGTLKPHERTEALIDQLRRLREKHHGAIPPEGVASFVADVMRQLLAQGGEATLMRLGSDGVVDAGGVPGIGAEPIGCECAKCGTRYGAHQIVTSRLGFARGLNKHVVDRSVYCDFCDHYMRWQEAATMSGHPNGQVVAGPWFVKSHVTFPAESGQTSGEA